MGGRPGFKGDGNGSNASASLATVGGRLGGPGLNGGGNGSNASASLAAVGGRLGGPGLSGGSNGQNDSLLALVGGCAFGRPGNGIHASPSVAPSVNSFPAARPVMASAKANITVKRGAIFLQQSQPHFQPSNGLKTKI